jgi:cell division protease FtsH
MLWSDDLFGSSLFLACACLVSCRRAKDLIQENIDILHKTAAVLMEKENIDGDEFQQIIMESQAQQYLKNDAPGVTIPYQTA